MKNKSILILFLVTRVLFADTLYLSNNNVVKGVITSMDGDVVNVETSNGVLVVSKDKIVRGEFFGTGSELSGSLVFEFLFNGSIKDSSGNAYPVKTKSIPYSQGVYGDDKGSLESKGTGEYFYIENSSSISAIDSFTIAMDFYPIDTSENSFLISCWKNTFADKKAEGRLSLSILNKSLMFYVVDNNGYYHSVGVKDAVNLKEWNSIAIRYDNGEMSIYLNGKTVAKNSISSDSLMKGEWPIYFLTAAYGNDFSKYNIKGKLDNFKMFDSSLSDIELNSLYQL